MSKLYIVGLGIYPDYLSIRGLEVVRRVETVFYECYTSPIPREKIVNIIKKYAPHVKLVELNRRDIEDNNCRRIIEELNRGKDTVLLVPGDPMFATTHVAIRIIVKKSGHDVELVPGVSILNAAISMLGLSPYRFGPIATITYPRLGVLSERPYDITKENLIRNLHTLLLLDIKDNGDFMPIEDALEILKMLEEKRREGIFSNDRVIIVLSRLGFPDSKIHVDTIENLMRTNLDSRPPHSIVVPAKLNHIERELLEVELNVRSNLLDLAGKTHL